MSGGISNVDEPEKQDKAGFPTVTLTFRLDNFDLDIDAPELDIEFVHSLVRRAEKLLDEHMAIVRAQRISQGIAAARINEARTSSILNKLKM